MNAKCAVGREEQPCCSWSGVPHHSRNTELEGTLDVIQFQALSFTDGENETHRGDINLPLVTWLLILDLLTPSPVFFPLHHCC